LLRNGCDELLLTDEGKKGLELAESAGHSSVSQRLEELERQRLQKLAELAPMARLRRARVKISSVHAFDNRGEKSLRPWTPATPGSAGVASRGTSRGSLGLASRGSSTAISENSVNHQKALVELRLFVRLVRAFVSCRAVQGAGRPRLTSHERRCRRV